MLVLFAFGVVSPEPPVAFCGPPKEKPPVEPVPPAVAVPPPKMLPELEEPPGVVLAPAPNRPPAEAVCPAPPKSPPPAPDDAGAEAPPNNAGALPVLLPKRVGGFDGADEAGVDPNGAAVEAGFCPNKDEPLVLPPLVPNKELEAPPELGV